MIVSQLSEQALQQTMGQQGLALQLGPFQARVCSPLEEVAAGVGLFYRDYPCTPQPFSDFHVNLKRPTNLRRWLRPQVLFDMDGRTPFKPLPRVQSFPLLEWGLNWCVSAHCHQYLIIHAACVAKNDVALILPAPPGAGKSTLCAALVSRGWRLLTDELTLLSLSQPGSIVPLPRPISLKNASIEVIREFAPDEYLGPSTRDTLKGTVAHMRAPVGSSRSTQPAQARWLVFPRYIPAAAPELLARPKAESFLQLAEQAFNFNVLGQAGFVALRQLFDQCQCFDFTYGHLQEAMEIFDELADAA